MTLLLLLCGILSSALYILTDVIGGLRYDGYSFTSQAVSELMAVDAPSKSFVDPLFMVYGVLTFAFGVGVYRVAAGQKPALRITSVLLIAYAIACLPGPFVPMAQRGADSGGDLPHILLTAVLVVLLLLAIGFGAYGFDQRFRKYSLITLGTILVSGVLSIPYGTRIAEGRPTPGFGIVERITIYSALLWIAVLAVKLMQSRGTGEARPSAFDAEVPARAAR